VPERGVAGGGGGGGERGQKLQQYMGVTGCDEEGVRLCLCVCVCVCVCVCNVCVHIYTEGLQYSKIIYIHIYTSRSIYICIYIYVCIYVHI